MCYIIEYVLRSNSTCVQIIKILLLRVQYHNNTVQKSFFHFQSGAKHGAAFRCTKHVGGCFHCGLTGAGRADSAAREAAAGGIAIMMRRHKRCGRNVIMINVINDYGCYVYRNHRIQIYENKKSGFQ